MIDESELLIQRQIRSPRSAAIAGIIFSLLTAAIMILLYRSFTASAANISIEWLETWSSEAAVVLFIVPFAGIAFLWFTGVIRDLFGDLEDRFFATIFLGSGIILVVMMFIWGAAFGAIFSTYNVAADALGDRDVLVFAAMFTEEILGVYFLRMAAVYMLSIGSLFTRTKVAPRWLTIGTIVVGSGFLLFADLVREIRFIFPVWVFVVSIYILVQNYRRSTEELLNT